MSYIDREAGLNAIKKLHSVGGCAAIDRDDAENTIMNIAAADVVAVVRCGECKHCTLTDEGEYNPNDIVCGYFMTDGMEENDYCSRGERR
jgi:hypothetical protein